MFDAFNRAGGANARRRTGTNGMHFSPSFGVRNGYIKDPNWPPAQMPEEGTAAQRRQLRVKCGFMIRSNGVLRATAGDLSAGGAKFSVESRIGDAVEVLVGDVSARATVLQVLEGGGQWKGDENKLIREASKVVVLVLPNGIEANLKLNAARKAYKARFNQESVLLVTQPACVDF